VEAGSGGFGGGAGIYSSPTHADCMEATAVAI